MTIEPHNIRFQFGTPVLPPRSDARQPEPPQMTMAELAKRENAAMRRTMGGGTGKQHMSGAEMSELHRRRRVEWFMELPHDRAINAVIAKHIWRVGRDAAYSRLAQMERDGLLVAVAHDSPRVWRVADRAAEAVGGPLEGLCGGGAQ